jgi:hypothetical protein
MGEACNTNGEYDKVIGLNFQWEYLAGICHLADLSVDESIIRFFKTRKHKGVRMWTGIIWLTADEMADDTNISAPIQCRN